MGLMQTCVRERLSYPSRWYEVSRHSSIIFRQFTNQSLFRCQVAQILDEKDDLYTLVLADQDISGAYQIFTGWAFKTRGNTLPDWF